MVLSYGHYYHLFLIYSIISFPNFTNFPLSVQLHLSVLLAFSPENWIYLRFVESDKAFVQPTTLRQDTSIDTEVDGEEDKEDEDKDGGDTDDDDFNIS